MKKIGLIISILLIYVYFFIGTTYAAFSCNINLSASNREILPGEKFTITVNTANLNTENGIIAMGAELEYDNSLELVDFEGINGWAAPFYNEGNGKLTTTRNKQMTDNGALIKIIFKVKDNAQAGTANIYIKDLVVSSGEIDNSIPNSSTAITIKSNVPTIPGDGNNNEQDDSNQEKPSTPTPEEPGNTNQGNNQGNTNTQNKPTNKPTNKPNNNTSSKPDNSSSNNVVDNTVSENQNNDIDSNEIENTIENENNVTNENSTNIVDNINEEKETKKSLKLSKTMVYTISIIGLIVVSILGFCIMRFWK
jgi:hypothetical protein